MHLNPNEYSNINDVCVPSRAPTEEPDEAWRPTDSRIAYRRDGISTKAVLVSLVTMGVLGTGGFLLMHSFISSDPSEGSGRAMAELPAATSPPSLIPPPPPPPSPPSFFTSPTATSERIASKLPAGAESATAGVAGTAISPVSSTLKAAVDLAAPPMPKVLSNVNVYPFPVLARQDVASAQSSPSAYPSPPATPLDESAGANPYDEAPETTTLAALRAPPQTHGAPRDNPVGSHE